MNGLTALMALTGLMAKCGSLLFVGAMVLLGLGCLAIWFSRTPIHRQRFGELTVGATLLWMVLAIIPLPRLVSRTASWHAGAMAENTAATVSQRPTTADAKAPLPMLESETNESFAGETISTAAEGVSPLEFFSTLPQTDLLSSRQEQSSKQLVDENDLDAIASSPDRNGIVEWVLTRASSIMEFARVKTHALPDSSFGPELVYLIGAVVCLGWLLFGQILLVSIRLRSVPAEPWLREIFESLGAKSGLSRTQLRISRACRRAISWGAIWPVIVLPVELCQRKNEAQLRMILLHELGHTSQGDAWGNLLLAWAFPLLYAQPLYWWLRSQVRLAAELMADDFAAQQTDKETYALELIALAKSANGVGVLWGVSGVVSSPTQFYRRMQMLIARETPLARSPSAFWRLGSMAGTGLAVALATALFGMQPSTGQQAAVETSKTEKVKSDDLKSEVLKTDDLKTGDSPELSDNEEVAKLDQRLEGIAVVEDSAVEADDIARQRDKLADQVKALKKQLESLASNRDQAETPDVLRKQKLGLGESLESLRKQKMELDAQSIELGRELKKLSQPPGPLNVELQKLLSAKYKVDRESARLSRRAGDDESKDQTVIIRSADGKDVEVIIENHDKTSRLTGKRFLLNGNKISELRVEGPGSIAIDSKDAAKKDMKNTDSWPIGNEKPVAKLPGINKDGSYRVLAPGEDGKFWLETWKKVGDEKPTLLDRTELPIEGFQEVIRRSEQARNKQIDEAGVQLTEKQGPRMVMVAAFGDIEDERRTPKEKHLTAEQAAIKLIYELRSKGIPAYAYYQDSKTAIDPDLVPIFGNPEKRPLIWVLAGNFSASGESDSAQETLNLIRQYRPKFMADQESGGMLRNEKAPFRFAFLRENPLLQRNSVTRASRAGMKKARDLANNLDGESSGTPASALKSRTAGPLDLISLATSLADALTGVERATDPDSKKQALRKVDLLSRIAVVEYKATVDDCQRLDQLVKAGAASPREVTELHSRRAILNEILETAGVKADQSQIESKN